MFRCSVHRLRNVNIKQFFIPESVALFSSANGVHSKKFGRRRQNLYCGDAGIRHTVRIMKETTTKGSKQIIDPDYYDTEGNDFDEKILKAGLVYDEVNKEQATKQNHIVNKIIERKYFKPPAEPNLMTYAAKEQVKYLNEMDPKTWTPQKLADSFPISVAAVKKLLKNKLYDLSEEEIAKHDKAVRKNWDQIRNRELNGGPISWEINKKLLSRDSKYEEENLSLPRPSKEWKLASMAKNSQLLRRPPREFENILQINPNKEKENDVALSFSDMETSVIIDKVSHKSNHLHEKKSVSIDEFKQNLQRNVSGNIEAKKLDKWFSTKEKRSLSATSETVPKKSPHEDIIEYFNGNVQKFNQISIPNLKWDVHKGVSNENDKEAYIYDQKLGYQRPYGSYYNKESIESADEKEKNQK